MTRSLQTLLNGKYSSNYVHHSTCGEIQSLTALLCLVRVVCQAMIGQLLFTREVQRLDNWCGISKTKKRVEKAEYKPSMHCLGLTFSFQNAISDWWLNLSYLGCLQKTFLHSHFGDFILNYSHCQSVQLLFLSYIVLGFLAHARLSESAPSHLPASDKCDVTPSEDH